jgi:LPXTG-site transpeptidase (sortase) family protein
MENKQAMKVLKLAVVLYLASFLILNWNDVSWIFNYKEVYGLVSDFFTPYPSIDASSMNAYFYPNHSATVSQGAQGGGENQTPVKTSYTEKQNTLEIPKISISVPIIFSENTQKNTVMTDLNRGVVFYPGSVYPGQSGQIVLLGHSAPPGWPKIKHDWVFTDLEKLSEGDLVYIDLNNKQYSYKVIGKKIIKKGADVPTENLDQLLATWKRLPKNSGSGRAPGKLILT